MQGNLLVPSLYFDSWQIQPNEKHFGRIGIMVSRSIIRDRHIRFQAGPWVQRMGHLGGVFHGEEIDLFIDRNPFEHFHLS